MDVSEDRMTASSEYDNDGTEACRLLDIFICDYVIPPDREDASLAVRMKCLKLTLVFFQESPSLCAT